MISTPRDSVQGYVITQKQQQQQQHNKNIFLDSGNIYKKHNFVDGDVVLVKTAEEIDEWVGADDDK